MLRMKRPLEMWSITADCFAAMIGWLMVMCEVEMTPAFGTVRRDAGRPGVGLEARTLRIGLAAPAHPARHRNERLELHLVGKLCERARYWAR